MEVPGATGLALRADGRYYAAGNDTLAGWALADFGLPGRIPIDDGQARISS